MHAITITPADEAAWLEMRRHDITSTQVAALFELPAYGATKLSLWHAKRQGVDLPFDMNERVHWGRVLEAAIAQGIAEQQGWQIEPMKDYMRIPELRTGSSFDFRILNHPSGKPVHLEIKNVDSLAFRDGWIVHDDGEIEAPPVIEMQLQHQMMHSGYELAYVGALVGGNTLRLIERPRDEAVIDAIRQECVDFWASIDAGTAPPATYPADNDTMVWLYNHSAEGATFDATNDAETATLVLEYKSLKQQAKALETQADTCKAKILERVQDAEKIVGPWGSVSCKRTRDNPGTLVTADMVGTFVGGRSGFRNFRVYTKGE